MARIDEYNQGPLDSAAVGVNRLDDSGVRIANSVKSVADDALELAQKKKHIQDVTNASSAASRFDFEAEQTRVRVAETAAKDNLTADDEAKLFQVESEKLRETYSKEIKSENTRAMFNTKAYDTIASRKLKSYEQGQKRVSFQIQNQVLQNMNLEAERVSNYFGSQTLSPDEKMAEYERAKATMLQNVDNAKLVYGSEDHKMLVKKTPEMLASAAILGQMQTSPDDAITMIDSGKFSKDLNQEKLAEYRRKAVTFKNQLNTRAEQDKLITERNNMMETTGMFLENKLNLGHVQEKMTRGDMTPEQAGIFETAIFNPESWDLFYSEDSKRNLPQPSAAGRAIINLLGQMEPDSDKFKEAVLGSVQAYNDKNLDKKDLTMIMHAAQNALTPETKQEFNLFRSALGMVSAMAGAEHVRPFMKTLKEGMNPMDLANEYIKANQQERNPKLAITDHTPTSTVNAFGLIKKLWLGDDAYEETLEEESAAEDDAAE